MRTEPELAAQPPARAVRSLDHVGLNVPDLDEAVRFFVDHLDAQVCFRVERFRDPDGQAAARLGVRPSAEFALAMLDLGGARLELLRWWSAREDASGTPWPEAQAIGAAHVGVAVADIDAVLAELRGVDAVEVLSEPLTFTDGPTPGLRNAFLRAPWGALIELLEWGTT